MATISSQGFKSNNMIKSVSASAQRSGEAVLQQPVQNKGLIGTTHSSAKNDNNNQPSDPYARMIAIEKHNIFLKREQGELRRLQMMGGGGGYGGGGGQMMGGGYGGGGQMMGGGYGGRGQMMGGGYGGGGGQMMGGWYGGRGGQMVKGGGVNQAHKKTAIIMLIALLIIAVIAIAISIGVVVYERRKNNI